MLTISRTAHVPSDMRIETPIRTPLERRAMYDEMAPRGMGVLDRRRS
jgi:hypothetical protein